MKQKLFGIRITFSVKYSEAHYKYAWVYLDFGPKRSISKDFVIITKLEELEWGNCSPLTFFDTPMITRKLRINYYIIQIFSVKYFEAHY